MIALVLSLVLLGQTKTATCAVAYGWYSVEQEGMIATSRPFPYIRRDARTGLAYVDPLVSSPAVISYYRLVYSHEAVAITERTCGPKPDGKFNDYIFVGMIDHWLGSREARDWRARDARILPRHDPPKRKR